MGQVFAVPVNFERDVATSDVFEPIGDLVFLLRLSDGCSQASEPEDQRDYEQPDDENKVKQEQ